MKGDRPFRQDRHFSAASSFHSGVSRGSPDSRQGDAGAGLTAVAFHFEPTQSAVEALTDGWRGLRWSTVAFHLN